MSQSQPEMELSPADSDSAALSFLANHRERVEKEVAASNPSAAQEEGGRSPAIEGSDDSEEEDNSVVESEEVEDEPEYEFEVDGKPQKVKHSALADLYRGNMFEKDYRAKTAEVAEAKRVAQAERQQIQQERAYHASHLNVLIQGLQTQLIGDQQELAQLAQTDPAAWVSKNAEVQQRYGQYQQAVQASQQLANQQTLEQQQADDEWRKSEAIALQEKLPEWRDAAVKERESREVAEYLLDRGYATDELSELFDHRALLVARDAAKWRAHQAAQKSLAEKKDRNPPQPLKSGAKRDNSSQQNATYNDALKRAQRSGSDDAALALLQAKRKMQ